MAVAEVIWEGALMPDKTEPSKKKLCFVVGPIGDEGSEVRIHADWLLEGIIEPVLAQFPEFRVKRADQDPRPGLIDTQMIDDLLNAELVIADLSLANPNAFYEIGIRHMAQKPIIHMQLAVEKPPFDVSLYRAIKFSRSKPKDLEIARIDLRRSIDAVLAPDYRVENPITNARGRIQLENSVAPENRVLVDEMRALSVRVASLESSAIPSEVYSEKPTTRTAAEVKIDVRLKPPKDQHARVMAEIHTLLNNARFFARHAWSVHPSDSLITITINGVTSSNSKPAVLILTQDISNIPEVDGIEITYLAARYPWQH